MFSENQLIVIIYKQEMLKAPSMLMTGIVFYYFAEAAGTI